VQFLESQIKHQETSSSEKITEILLLEMQTTETVTQFIALTESCRWLDNTVIKHDNPSDYDKAVEVFLN
jgi:hypothetical protein